MRINGFSWRACKNVDIGKRGGKTAASCCNTTEMRPHALFMRARRKRREDAVIEQHRRRNGSRVGKEQEEGDLKMAEIERQAVTFSLPELWLLHDFVRHEVPEAKSWRYPPASEDLNEEIALAIEACETHDLEDYTLLLSKGDLFVIDYFVRRDHKTPEGATGKKVLLKAFRARKEMMNGMPEHNGDDRTYREVTRHVATDQDAG